MKTFESYFSEEAVVSALINIRLKSAAKRHDLHFFRNVSPDATNPADSAGEVDQLLPPRSEWLRPRAAARMKLGRDAATKLSIRLATLQGLRSPACNQPWKTRLQQFLHELRLKAMDPSSAPLRKPEVFAMRKESNGKQPDPGYRVLTRFADLPDRLLIGQTARYLTQLFDGLFLDCSHAFRIKPAFSRDGAVSLVRNYVARHREKSIYVAECDIQKFFDCIDHGVARQAFSRVVERLAAQGVKVNRRAQIILEMYLDAYDYYGVGLPGAHDCLTKNGNHAGRVDSPDPTLLQELRAGKAPGRVGIPQGGALSPLLANLVLDAADRAVVGNTSDPDLLYLRYCDDMIVLHNDRAQCTAALNRYMAAAQGLLLPVHAPAVVPRYSRLFHDSKSKAPYRIGEPAGGKRAVPWISFLGYQVHWDGTLRVRTTSLKRHTRKQGEFVQRIISLVRHPRANIRLSALQIESRVSLRLVSSAIGRASISGRTATDQPCWMNAFRLLDRNAHSETQMRQLDRSRDRLLRKLKRAVKGLSPAMADHETQAANGNDPPRLPRRSLFIGRPLSYCGHLIGDRPISIGHVNTKSKARYGHEY